MMRLYTYAILFSLSLLQACSSTSIIDSESSADTAIAQDIERIVFIWADYFNSGNWTKIETLRDSNEEAPYYLGEERDFWLIGREGLTSYFNPPKFVRNLMDSVNVVPYRLRVRQVSDAIVIATWDNSLDLAVKGRPVINDDYRVNAVFRKTDSGWKFIHYAELQMSALQYMEHLYRAGVTPGFDRFKRPFDAD